MRVFCVGDWVIDAQRKKWCVIRAILPDSFPTLYVLEDAECKNYYISDDENLIKYSEKWFSEHK